MNKKNRNNMNKIIIILLLYSISCFAWDTNTKSGHFKDSLKCDSLRNSMVEADAQGKFKKHHFGAGLGITKTESGDSSIFSLYTLPSISSLTNTRGINYAGQTVTNVTVNWTLIGAAITSQALTDCTPALGDRSHVFNPVSLTTDKYYTLTIDTGSTVVGTATTWVIFYIAKFYGTSVNAAPTDSNVEAGTTSWQIQNAVYRNLSSTAITGGWNYIFYAYPSAWGDVQLYVNGFATTWIKTTISITNSYGDTRDYYVLTSPTPIVGTIYLSASGI
jgi:hypothetical protein